MKERRISKPYRRAIFLFRRDLRVVDNRGLNRARQRADTVQPLFVLDPRQLDEHPYRSDPALAFMAVSLSELASALGAQGGRLQLRYGHAAEVLAELVTTQSIDAVFVNRDFSAFSRVRDDELAACCAAHGCAWHAVDDLLLQPPERCLKGDGQPYRIFTPFYRNAAQLPVALPAPLTEGRWLDVRVSPEQPPLPALLQPLLRHPAPGALWQGGRREALGLLAQLRDCGAYAQQRDLPALTGTSRLSAHLKFGTCSVRELYYRARDALGEEHPLLRQLYWRDFFTHIAWHFPHVFGGAFDPRYDALAWRNDAQQFAAWCRGQTGFPIVDSGMRELNQSGYMHNRVRMIVASFLVKDLQIDWRWGERYFARHLIDYDPCVNNGSWQWAASTGCDAQPWFRIFNPWLQQRKFDSDARYIRRWVPELATLESRAIHRLEREPAPPGYPAPLVIHQQQREIAKQRYRQALAQEPG